VLSSSASPDISAIRLSLNCRIQPDIFQAPLTRRADLKRMVTGERAHVQTDLRLSLPPQGVA
jgi:hypothetical protein